jgi:tetrahydromethanopterin S-methyltransferase subunit F
MKTDENSKTNPVNENTGTNKNEKAKTDIEKKTRDEGVKKGVIMTSIIGFIILFVAVIIGFSQYSREHNKLINLMETQKTSLTEKITARDSVISEWITTFDDIEKNIALIKEKEKVITFNSLNAEIPKDKKLQVLEDIKYINTLLEQNKKKIASLTAQLQKSGGTMKVLQNKISQLEASMKQNETEISELKTSLVNKKFEVEQLNTQMIVMQDTIAKKDEKINTQTNELNKAFYISGTYKELKAKGLLTKEGGFIGLGKTESLTGNFSDDSFVQIDITQTKSISVNSKSAKLITEHPAGSYEFIRDKNKVITSIEIKDPALFWKISKYAVVEITK